MKLSRLAIPVALILAGLALEMRIRQFVLKVLDLKQEKILVEDGNFIVPIYVLTPNELLIQEGIRINVKSLRGDVNLTLQDAAQKHAAYQASIGIQGHQNWEVRWSDLRRKLPECKDIFEVANESWPGQSAEDAAKEMYKSWEQSSGHWSAVNGECKYWGYAMVLSDNGTWYAAGIFAK